MYRPLFGVVVVLLLLCAGTAVAEGPAQDILGALSKELGCKGKSTAGLRVWCLGPRAFESGKRPAARASRALIGVTVELRRGQNIRQALLGKVHLSTLALRKVGGRFFGKITGITPSNAAEKKSLAKAVFNVAAVLKGRAPRATLDKGLYGYVQSLPKRATYPVVVQRGEWQIAGASSARIRQLGAIWVSVEVPKARNGIFLSLFTPRFAAR